MDNADRADLDYEEMERVRERNRLIRQAREFQAWRITDCKECGEPIEAARKAVMPSATTCLECQRKIEHGEAQTKR